MRAASRLTPLLLLTLLWGCSPTTSPLPSVQPSASPSEGAVSGLPPGCAPHEVRGPDGERIDLDGTWVEEVGEDEAPMTWWIRTQGDCLWGAGTVDDVPTAGASVPDTVQTIRGRLGSDLIIDGEILRLGPYASSDAARAIYSRSASRSTSTTMARSSCARIASTATQARAAGTRCSSASPSLSCAPPRNS